MLTEILVWGVAILLVVVVIEAPRLKGLRRKFYIKKGIRKLEKFVNRKID